MIMIIREVTLSDIPSLAQLAQKTYADTFAYTLSKDGLRDALKTRSEDYFSSVFGKDTILVAQEENRLIGFIQFGEVKTEKIKSGKNDIELKKIYIDTGFQSKGIGTQLIQAMFAHDRFVCAENIYLDVFPKNTNAINFYKKFGFQIIGKVPFKANGKILGYDLLMKRSGSNNDTLHFG